MTIHNDLTKAHQIADTSVGQLTLNDGKGILAGAAALDGIAAGSWGITMAATAPVEGATAASIVGAGVVGLGTAALYAGAVIGVGAAVVMAADLGRNSIRQANAQDEIRTAQTLSLHT